MLQRLLSRFTGEPVVGGHPAPVVPGTAAKQRVQTALNAVSAAETAEENADQNLKTRYAGIKAKIEKSYDGFPRWMIDRLVTEKSVQTAALADPDYLQKEEALRVAVQETYKAHNAAILEALIVYQLVPPAAGSNMVGKPWLPRYSRHEVREESTGQWRKRTERELAAERRANAAVGGDVAAARTRGNGVMEFYGQAFKTPDDLAINLYHETSHWVDVVGRSGGFKQSDPPEVSFRTEQRAYERAAVFAAKLGVNTQRHLQLAAQFKLQADQAQAENLRWDQVSVRHPNWIGRDRQGLLAITPAAPELSSGDEAFLQKKLAEAQARVAKDRELREKVELRKEAARQRDEDEELKTRYLTLAQRSCAEPGSVSQAELDDLPNPHGKDFMGFLPEEISGCDKTVYLNLRRGADADEIKALSAPAPIPPSARIPDPVQIPSAYVPPLPFSRLIPRLKEFAVEACQRPEQVPIERFLSQPIDFSNKDYDNQIAREIGTSLSDCSYNFFFRLSECLYLFNVASIIYKY